MTANRLADSLTKQGVPCERIHGNRSQAQRTAALAGFKDGRFKVLVATDIAARGIDVEALSHVINFDLPEVPETYIHRIGRTARMGKAGAAWSLVTPEEGFSLRDIERTQLECAAKFDGPGRILARRDDCTGRAHLCEPRMILGRPHRLFQPG